MAGWSRRSSLVPKTQIQYPVDQFVLSLSYHRQFHLIQCTKMGTSVSAAGDILAPRLRKLCPIRLVLQKSTVSMETYGLKAIAIELTMLTKVYLCN